MASLRDKLEIVGIIAVILSLLFLAYEIRKNTDTSAAQAIFDLNEAARESQFLEATDPDLVPLILKAENDFDALTEDEQYRFRRWVFAYLNLFESAWNHHHRGVTSDADMEAWQTAYCNYMSRGSFRRVAQSIDAQRSQFRKESDQWCQERKH